jgi:hypothetical protein
LLEFLRPFAHAVRVIGPSDPAGSAIHFSAQADGKNADYLKAPISWQAGEWHQVTLAYCADYSVLFLDGGFAAEGAGVSVWPDDKVLAASGFCVGSDAAGASLAQGQFDELYTLDHPCTAQEVAFNYRLMGSAPKLGPISAEEEAARRDAAVKRRAEREAALAEQENNAFMMQSSSNCDTNGPVRLTNIVCTLETNGSATVSFDIHGGVDYELYDIFRTTNLLGSSITNSTWQWLEQGPTCYNYTYTNEPLTQSFYVLGTPLDTDFDGLPDAFEGLVSHTSPLLADTDGDGVPDGDEDATTNGIPDRADYSGFTRAVIYPVVSTATEAGAGGEFNLLLPAPAPTNGTTILLSLGGTAGYESDYLLSTFLGYITNEVVFFAGEYLKRIFVTAVNNTVQQTYPRTVSVSLLSSANYTLDPTPAKVSILDDDLPTVGIFNEDTIAVESAGTVMGLTRFDGHPGGRCAWVF